MTREQERGWWAALKRLFRGGQAREEPPVASAVRHREAYRVIERERQVIREEYRIVQGEQGSVREERRFAGGAREYAREAVGFGQTACDVVGDADDAPDAVVNDEPERSASIHTYTVRDDFLTPAEASFFRVLSKAAAEGALVFPKVRLADLLYAPRQEERQAAWNRISRKHVDFVLCHTRTLRPGLVIELDDRPHRRRDRVERDAFVDRIFADAGLPLRHIPVQRSYSVRVVAELIAEAAPALLADTSAALPVATSEPAVESRMCDLCGGQMVVRTARQGTHMGKPFWGCTNYPQCRNIIPV